MPNEIELSKNKNVTIIDTTISIIEYQGQRVVTLSMIDQLHHRPDGTAKRNFTENRNKFEEGKHFFHLDYHAVNSLYEFRTAGITPNSQGLIIITERGYCMLVKSFNDDFAWEVQDQLVDSYFNNKKPLTIAEFLVQQANLILDHEIKIKQLEQRQNNSDMHLAETRCEIQMANKKADEAFAAASAALSHKYGDTDYYTVVGFCGKYSIKLQGEEAKVRGLHATHLSRENDKVIIKIPDDRWGKVNSYHISILQKVFEDKLKKP